MLRIRVYTNICENDKTAYAVTLYLRLEMILPTWAKDSQNKDII